MAYPYGATNAVSLGPFSASTLQQPSSIAIGASAGRKNQGSNAIAIGTLAGQLNQHQSTIVINATGIPLDTTADNAVYMGPMRFMTASNVMSYNPTSKEVSHTDTLSSLTVSSLSTRSIGYSTLVGSSMNTSVITANLLYCNTISTVGGIVVGGGSGGGGGGGGSSGPVSILSATPSAPQSIPADTNTLVLWDASDNAQSVGITGLTYISGLFNNVTPTALPIHVDYSLELSITGGGASYIGVNGSATAYGRLLNESNIFSNAYTVLVPPGGTIGIYYRDVNSTVVQTGSRITLTLLSATVGQVATMLVSPTTIQAMPASASLSLVQWGTTDNGQSYGSTGLSYSSGVFINITSMTLPVLVQYTLNLDSTMGGYSAIGINGTTTVYGGAYNDTNGFSNSYTVMLPAYGTLGIYYMDNGATNIQTSSTLRLTILMAGERGATGASPFTLSGTTASYTAGNVGIGTTAPSTALDVSGTVNSVNTITVSDARPAANGLLRLVATGGLNYVQSGLALTSDSKAPLIFGSVFNVSEWMRIITSGNVGIGTTVPTALLHLRPTTSALRITSNLNNTSTRPALSTTPGTYEIRGSSGWGDGYNDGFLRLSAGGGTDPTNQATIDLSGYSSQADMNNNIRFATNGAERMRIDLSGNVGIGTTNPTYPLQLGVGLTSDLGGHLNTCFSDMGYTAANAVVNSGGNITGSGPYTFTTNAINGSIRISTTLLLNTAYRVSITCNITVGSGYLLVTDGVGVVYQTALLTSLYQTFIFNGAAVVNNQILYFQVISASGTVFNYSALSISQSVVAETGLVGIGTNTPAATLHIKTGSIGHPSVLRLNQNVSTYGSSANGARLEWFTTFNGNGADYFQAAIQGVDDNIGNAGSGAGGLAFLTYNNTVTQESMRISSNGNVGIGTASPSTKLVVSNTTPFVNSNPESTSALATTFTLSRYISASNFTLYDGQYVGRIAFSGADYSWAAQKVGADISAVTRTVTGNGASCDLLFGTLTAPNDAAPTEKMRITATGSVGIGTANPTVALELCNTVVSSNAPFIRLNNTAGGASNQVGIYLNPFSSRSGGDSSRISAIDNGNASSHLTFWTAPTGSSTTSTERMRITTEGSVGIGTASPVTRLTIAPNITSTTTQGTGQYGGIHMVPSGTNDSLTGITFGGNNANTTESQAGIICQSSSVYGSQLIFQTTNNFSQGCRNRMTITAPGNVGIGLINPAFQLDLSTDAARKLSTTTWTTGSDERLKTNITLADTQRCVDIIKTLPLKHYTWRQDIDRYHDVRDRSKLGWVAQDVAGVFPKAVYSTSFKYNQVYKDVEVVKEDGTVIKEQQIVSEDVIEDCLSLDADQVYAVMYGALQKVIQDKEQLSNQLAATTSQLAALTAWAQAQGFSV